MELSEVREAAARLRERGERVSVRAVHDVLGRGSPRDILQHLRTMRAESGAGELADDGAAPDLIEQAEHALQQTQARVRTLEAQVTHGQGLLYLSGE